MSANEFQFVARAIKLFGQQTNQRFVSRCVNGRCGDFNTEFCAQQLTDLVPGGAWVKLDGQQ